MCLVAQLCPTLYGPMDHSPPGSSVHWDSPSKNTGVGCHALFQGIFPTQGSKPGLPPCRWILYYLSHQKSPDTRWVILIKSLWVQVPCRVLAGFESQHMGSSPNVRWKYLWYWSWRGSSDLASWNKILIPCQELNLGNLDGNQES